MLINLNVYIQQNIILNALNIYRVFFFQLKTTKRLEFEIYLIGISLNLVFWIKYNFFKKYKFLNVKLDEHMNLRMMFSNIRFQF